MPKPYPSRFRRRAVELARLREKPIAQVARDLGIAESGLRRWMKQTDIDEGEQDGLTTVERAELVGVTSEEAGAGDGGRDPQARIGLRARENVPPKKDGPVVQERR